jgi:hypothetical protein
MNHVLLLLFAVLFNGKVQSFVLSPIRFSKVRNSFPSLIHESSAITSRLMVIMLTENFFFQ